MNIYNFNDESFKSSNLYQEFINDNQGLGNLKIRAYSANLAVPIEDLHVIVSKEIDNNKIIFYEGNTNESGVIEKILLPAPVSSLDNMKVPNKTTYDILAKYHNISNNYKVNIYDNICVVQNINILPYNMGEL